jgi:flagellar protein FlaG
MEPKVTAVAAVPKPAKVEPARKVEPPAEAAEAKAAELTAAEGKAKRDPEPPKAPDQAEMRLVIEMDQASGSYVYKTINRATGEVISQLPRAEVLKLRDGGRYAAGAVIRTKA